RHKYRVSREFGPETERSFEPQKEGPSSSSHSVSSKKLQMVTPVLPKSLDSPVQPRKSLDSPLMMAEQVHPPKSQDPLVQTVASIQISQSPESSSASCGSGAVGSLDSPLQPWKSLDSSLMMAEQVQQPKSQDSLVQMVASMQLSKPLDSSSASTGSGAVGSDLGAAPFDICMGNSKGIFKLNRPLHEIKREEKRLRARELSNSAAQLQHLRPGMVLLKSFLKPDDQVEIIKLCRELGVGTGGFYQPAYRDGGKLSLRMMCLGKNWDPDSRSYGDTRPYDGAQPPQMPQELTKFVEEAIKASHDFLKQRGKGATDPAAELPLMSPDICIVNFYTTGGKLGLHKDKDEDKSSLDKGLPVVSFSLGDTAEFLYGDDRDVDKASKIKLESGDVLIFGGQSRHIFHGVSSIAPKSAPLWVTDKANLRPGRLNLTFRQHSAPRG
uniref:Fe2OG dioxygenase domain-containing protein n=2 Tax=Aegilops tauschii subsp. strangulata TaxID=200361 RepID=A0A453M7Z2_AEGTS